MFDHFLVSLSDPLHMFSHLIFSGQKYCLLDLISSLTMTLPLQLPKFLLLCKTNLFIGSVYRLF